MLLRRRSGLAVAQDLGKRADRGHRRAQLVADLAEEGVLLDRQLRSASRSPRAAGGRCGPARRDLRLQLAGIFHDLRGLVGHRHQVLDRDRRRRRRSGRPSHAPSPRRPSPPARAPAAPGSRASARADSRAGPAARASRWNSACASARAEDALRHDQQILGLRDARRPSRAGRAECSKTLTNCAPCSRSSGRRKAEQRDGDRRRRC